MAYRIMIIEDDDKLQRQISDTLKNRGYLVVGVVDFTTVQEQVDSILPDLIILDINLPYYDGNYYCHSIRKKHHMPIIVTSARNGDQDQILSMELGSDDYIVKPFSITVLLSRIAAALRRAYGEYSKTEGDIEGLVLDENGMKLVYHGQSAILSKNEFRLMKLFFQSPDKVIEREEMLEALWDDREFVDDNTLTVNISRIKKKLEELGFSNAIQTKRGVGYLFSVQGPVN